MANMILQNPAPKNHRITVAVDILVNYGDAEANPEIYSSEAITEFFKTGFECPDCRTWHLNSAVCGMDTVYIGDILDEEIKPTT